MPSELEMVYRAARREYELGRLARALRHAAAFTLVLGAFAAAALGTFALAWLPVTLLAVTFTEWRGALVMKAARRGVLAGVVLLLLPLSLLRPCCGIDAKAMGTTCCITPSACWGAGALVGLSLALLLPDAPRGRRREAALGLLLGVTSVALVRCASLFAGEAVGLLGGMAAGIAASAMARAWLAGRRSREAV